jgi:hypothetical protein
MKKREKKKRNKKYIPPKVEAESKKMLMPTANASRIYDLMKARKVKGKYKDYVIICGSRLIDWLGSYEIRVDDGDEIKRCGTESMVLVHKSKLKEVIGKAAEKFWKCGMRTNIGVASRRIGCAKKQ